MGRDEHRKACYEEFSISADEEGIECGLED